MALHSKTSRRVAAGLAAVAVAAASVAYGTTAANAATTRAADTLIDTDLGALQGATDGEVRSWLGVPYAAPPVDELRWESPQPAATWEGVREATEFGAACAQGQGNMPAVPSEEEDCLFLNVYSPDSGQDSLPVMVWFHGGGNTYGAASQYDPSQLVADGEAVVVTVNYRQGLFGSMSHPALDEGGETTSGNYGLEDQQAALGWVGENAAAFGGDEDNVTIFGESGGGFNVCAHLAAPTSAGLFDKAIMQSSPCATDWAPSRAEGQARDVAFAESLGCADAAAAAACLRDLEPAALNEVVGGRFEVHPVMGGPVMAISTTEALESGEFNHVPVLTGINRDEEQLTTAGQEVLTGEHITEADYRAALEAGFGEHAAAIATEYPVEDFENPAKALGAVQTDASWASGQDGTVELLAEHTDTFAYELGVTDSPWFSGFARPEWKTDAYHMVDVAFLFDTTIFEERTARHERLADRMIGAWSTFARTGDPDGRGRWHEAEGDCVRQLSPEGARNVDFTEEHHLAFWADLNA